MWPPAAGAAGPGSLRIPLVPTFTRQATTLRPNQWQSARSSGVSRTRGQARTHVDYYFATGRMGSAIHSLHEPG
jgi:hypothetical protein